MLKLADIPYEFDFSLKSAAQNCTKIDTLMGLVLLLVFLTFLPRIANTYESTILKIRITIHRGNFTRQFDGFSEQLNDYAKKKSVTDLSIIAYGDENKEIYSWTTTISKKAKMLRAVISLYPGKFILGEDAQIIVTTYPDKKELRSQLEHYAIGRFIPKIRMAFMDIVKQFIDYKEHKSPTVGIYGINVSPHLFPIIAIFISLLCYHYLSLYKADVAKLNNYDSLNNDEINSSIVKLIPKPTAIKYQNQFYSPISIKFIIIFSIFYIIIALICSFSPLISRSVYIFKNGVFINYLFEGCLLVASLLILRKICKNILILQAPKKANPADAKIRAVD